MGVLRTPLINKLSKGQHVALRDVRIGMELDFEIDKITESIENAQTGETLDTLVLPVTKNDMEAITQKNGWLFDWKLELSEPEHQVYKLVTEQAPQTIQGMVSLEKLEDHVFMHLIENAPYNIGKGKTRNGGRNMIAIDTKEKLDWLLEALENNEIQIVSRKLTEEDKKEISRELAEYRATHPKPPARDMVLA